MRTLAGLLIASLLSAQQTDTERFTAALDLTVESIEKLHPDPYWRQKPMKVDRSSRKLW